MMEPMERDSYVVNQRKHYVRSDDTSSSSASWISKLAEVQIERRKEKLQQAHGTLRVST
jgi:hypothetical protein